MVVSVYNSSKRTDMMNLPMNKSKIMNGLYGQDAFRQIKTSYILRECVVFYEHCHQVSSREELHY